MKSDKILTRNDTYGIWQSLNHDLFKIHFWQPQVMAGSLCCTVEKGNCVG